MIGAPFDCKNAAFLFRCCLIRFAKIPAMRLFLGTKKALFLSFSGENQPKSPANCSKNPLLFSRFFTFMSLYHKTYIKWNHFPYFFRHNFRLYATFCTKRHTHFHFSLVYLSNFNYFSILYLKKYIVLSKKTGIFHGISLK